METTQLAANDTNEILLIGDGYENPTYRIHRYATSVKVVHLPFAGKRGKAVEELVAYGTLPEDFVQNISILVARQAPLDAVREAFALGVIGQTAFRVEERKLRGVDVTPGGCPALVITTAKVFLKVELNTFMVRDRLDLSNEPTAIPRNRAKTSCPVLYKWVKAHKDELEGKTFHEVLAVLKTLKVDYHHYLAVD